MILYRLKVIALLLSAVLFIGCAASRTGGQGTFEGTNTNKVLLVGVTPDNPPIIFRQNEVIKGVEADLARELAAELKRQVSFVDLSWDEQIPALLDNRIDIIMSGMTATRAREIRIAFTDPYLKSGLIAAMRAEDVHKYNSKDGILNSYAAVGAVKDTTGDVFVKRNFPNAVRKTFVPNPKDGVNELKRRAIGIFVYDAPSVLWLVSENEADIAAFWEPLTEEYLAWGVRKEDTKFLADVNGILRRWKQDGTLNRVLGKWLPAEYLKRLR